jgi:hypothetical protein
MFINPPYAEHAGCDVYMAESGYSMNPENSNNQAIGTIIGICMHTNRVLVGHWSEYQEKED